MKVYRRNGITTGTITKFQSPCGELVMKAVLGLFSWSIAMVVENCVSVPLRGIGYESGRDRKNLCLVVNVFIVSVPLRGIGYESTFDSDIWDFFLGWFQSPCGELVMKGVWHS